MPKQIRFKTDYPGIYFVKGISHITGKPERIYYMRYMRDGIYVEEKAGRQYQDKMTPAKAAAMRTLKIRGDKPTNEEKRQIRKNKPTINYLWETYKISKPHLNRRLCLPMIGRPLNGSPTLSLCGLYSLVIYHLFSKGQ